MTSLIITIIAIALTMALASVAVYYGSNSFTRYQEEARVMTYVNEAQQIKAASELYRADNGDSPAVIAELVSGQYLKQVPNSQWSLSSSFAVTWDKASVSDEVCLRFNKKQGVDLIPSCKDSAYADIPVCCTAALATP